MKDDRKQRLMKLGVEVLADALLGLAVYDEEVEDLIERLVATPKENVQRFKRKLSNLKRMNQTIHWRAASDFGNELEMLLKDLEAGVRDPLEGVGLVASFFELDSTLFEICDDSSGCIGMVYSGAALDLFVKYASACEDKEKIADVLLQLNQRNDYGVRDLLIDVAGAFLPEPIIRNMISTLREWADRDSKDSRRFLFLVASLARQIRDPELFEKTSLSLREDAYPAGIIKIATVYFENDQIETAHAWLKRIPENELFMSSERNKLLLQIYEKQGDVEQLAGLLLKAFRGCPRLQELDNLLEVIGQDKRQEVIDAEIGRMLERTNLNLMGLDFMFSVGKVDEAEDYLISRVDQLKGHAHYDLPSMAKLAKSKGRYLVAVLIFRCLLLSILERGYTKAYRDGVGYLKELDKLSGKVVDWRGIEDHSAFKSGLLQNHGLKRSFWSKYQA